MEALLKDESDSSDVDEVTDEDLEDVDVMEDNLGTWSNVVLCIFAWNKKKEVFTPWPGPADDTHVHTGTHR